MNRYNSQRNGAQQGDPPTINKNAEQKKAMKKNITKLELCYIPFLNLVTPVG